MFQFHTIDNFLEAAPEVTHESTETSDMHATRSSTETNDIEMVEVQDLGEDLIADK